MHYSEKISLYGIFLNIVLFAAKITVGLLSNSLAILSDAFNSLTDIISYSGIYLAVKISNQRSDKSHPFGHHRAEPMAGFIVAIFTGILAFEILRAAITNIITPRISDMSIFSVIVLVFTIIVKLFMSSYFQKKGTELRRPAIKAAGVDSRNDVLSSSVALIGVVGYMLGYKQFDSIAAIFISMYIFYSGYKIGKENVDYLMGHAPPDEDLKKIKATVLQVKGVKGINEVRAHYVGSFIHIEIHIEVDKNLTTLKSHDIGKDVERAAEKFDFVDKAFIHIDPV
ncbi:MAG: cation diffusion facilitator family transporter [archaeon]